MITRSSLYDHSNSFGWISITLHWTTTVLVVVLWLVGMSITSQPAEEVDARRSLHITLGLIAWLPLAGRILWRLGVAHPRVTGQSSLLHSIARATHYLILAALTVMIFSGPVMAWALPQRSEIADTVRKHLASVRQEDVNSHGLGVVARDPKTGKALNHVMIPRNTRLPVEVRQTFYTNNTGQQRVNIKVTEGDAPDPVMDRSLDLDATSQRCWMARENDGLLPIIRIEPVEITHTAEIAIRGATRHQSGDGDHPENIPAAR